MSWKSRAVAPVRNALRSGATRWPAFRRVVSIGARELEGALHDDVYRAGYFGAGPTEDTRESAHADVAAYLIWRFLPAERTVDVGCSFGYVVEAQREIGLDAQGLDISQYALDHAATGARGHTRYGNLMYKLPLRKGSFDVVSALETLEHLPPECTTHALSELRRVTNGFVVATIPSFGPNANGPGGWFDVKVRPERLDYYKSLGEGYEGPIPYDDLYRDGGGRPIEGHLTIASFGWWTRQFEGAGFVRCGDVERRMHPHLARLGLTKYWNLYVFRVPEVAEPTADVRSASEIADIEKRWGFTDRVASPDDAEAVRIALS